AQFRYINAQAVDFLGAAQPVISVDTKRKELVGNSRTMVASAAPRVSPNSSTYMTSSIQSCAGQSRMGSTTSTPMSDGSASAPTMTRLPLPSTPSAGGGRRWGGSATPKPNV